MSEKNWVPGFIWLTPRGVQIKHKDYGEKEYTYAAKPPILVAVGHIANVMPHRTHFDSNDIARASVTIGSVSEECYEVTETVEEIAALIRQEWAERTIKTAIAGAQYGTGEYVLKEGSA